MSSVTDVITDVIGDVITGVITMLISPGMLMHTKSMYIALGGRTDTYPIR